MTKIVFEAVSDVGCKRNKNEDMALVIDKLIRDDSLSGELKCTNDTHVAFAIADGMGGYEGGEIASEIALRSLTEYIKTVPAKLSESDFIFSLKEWAAKVNGVILASAASNSRLSEMGTTLVAFICYEERLATVNIGDSRLYRFRDGVLKQLTTDHSERELTGNANVPPNLIYNFVGNDSCFFADVELRNGQVFSGDVFLLCSDGLSDMITDEEISLVLETGESITSTLVRKAKEAGGKDNVSVLLLSFANDIERAGD